MEYFMNFYKKFNNIQLVQNKEGHNIIVGCFFTFAFMINLLTTDNELVKLLLIILAIYRLVTIHIHNMNVYFFDKFQLEGIEITQEQREGKRVYKIIENISSYKRMLILNILVLIEIILLVFKFRLLFIIGILAGLPTICLIGHCLNYFIKKEIINE